MCGIVGGWLPGTDGTRLSLSLAALSHRGPDGQGSCVDADSGVLLGHVRLAIIDLSDTGRQPMASDEGQVTLVFNGEIYNYRELRADLEAKGALFNGRSDTEVLLRLYLDEGMAMLQRLDGIFAFAIHDRRCDELFLVRDALGVKPLYYSEGEYGVAFASEIKALLPLVDFPRRLDAAALHRYLTFLWCPGEGTPFSAVRKLEPGGAVRISNGRVAKKWRWYTPPVMRRHRSIPDERQAVAQVEAGLRTAVQRQLVSDVPVGAFLSGGLDSSAVVAFAREQLPDLRCFTIEAKGGVDSGETEDLPYARRVAAHLGVPLDVVEVDSSQMASDLEEMVWQLDEPLADPAPLNVLYISKLARQAGIKVLLSGAGGDDLFTGYRRHLALRYEPVWSWLPSVARGGLGKLGRALDQRTALGRRAARLFSGMEETGDARLAAYFFWSRRDDLVPLYSDEMRNAITDIRAEQPMLDLLAELPSETSPVDRMLALEQRFFLADHNLMYTDKMSMAAGVEVRVPFLDRDLVALAASIPDRFKQRGREGKWVLKKAMESHLPHDVIYRPKTGFGAPLRRWMRYELREMMADLLSEKSLRRRGLFDPQAVQRMIAANDTGKADASYTLLSLMCVEIWCRRFVDVPGEASDLPASLT